MFKKLLGIVTVAVLVTSTVSLGAFSENINNKATVTSVKNLVELKYGESTWRSASVNQLIRPGTKIRTGSLSGAEIMYPDGTITRLGSRTVLTILDKETREVEVASGNIWFKVTKKSIGLKIYAPKALAAISGTEGGMKVDVVGENLEDEKTSANYLKFASSSKKFPVRIAEGEGDSLVTFGLVEGTANFSTDGGYSQDVSGGQMVSFSTMDPNNINFQTGLDNGFIQGQFDAGNPPDNGNGNNNGNNGNNNNGNNNNGNNGNQGNNNGNDLNNQNGNQGNNNNGNNGNQDNNNGNTGNGVQNQDLNPSNPVTNLENKNQVDPTKDQETSPVTGTLELIIK